MRLYGITAKHVETIIQEPDSTPELVGRRYHITKAFEGEFKGMPIKVIYVLERDYTVVVLSAYPLKRSYRR